MKNRLSEYNDIISIITGGYSLDKRCSKLLKIRAYTNDTILAAYLDRLISGYRMYIPINQNVQIFPYTNSGWNDYVTALELEMTDYIKSVIQATN